MARIACISLQIFKFILRTFRFALILVQVSILLAINFITTESIKQIESLKAFCTFIRLFTIQTIRITWQTISLRIGKKRLITFKFTLLILSQKIILFTRYTFALFYTFFTIQVTQVAFLCTSFQI
ncbi:hypothetical protein IMG5_086490 [Ichthyophthirius multifiliis]|uniref:Transmembrane protein n=1 Tax=Ichthyophthirius multifiliis TaxID=5932 RepID=G0QR02_ICHMU|nr:hypothetical protein IMG5_086490 [Ichthyophthirius multifiliis]EGR32353.1 hypothetical protein IMG5_086490 [Ichthyophthirius multifiliis]|eukprot:XP_004035839.1 hypothetical protein IMG5_086490 [Ichthyophthirius multifiliis]